MNDVKEKPPAETLAETAFIKKNQSVYAPGSAQSEVRSHTLAILAINEPGVLARVMGFFSGRGYNIDSLTAAETNHDESLSHITVVTHGTMEGVQQIKDQLRGMVSVKYVRDLTVHGDFVERELALLKVHCAGEKRIEALRIADIFRARVVDSTLESFIFEVTGASEKVGAFIKLMAPLGLVDISRTGVAAMVRGTEALGDS